LDDGTEGRWELTLDVDHLARAEPPLPAYGPKPAEVALGKHAAQSLHARRAAGASRSRFSHPGLCLVPADKGVPRDESTSPPRQSFRRQLAAERLDLDQTRKRRSRRTLAMSCAGKDKQPPKASRSGGCNGGGNCDACQAERQLTRTTSTR